MIVTEFCDRKHTEIGPGSSSVRDDARTAADCAHDHANRLSNVRITVQ